MERVKYPERHWTYEEDEDEQEPMPAFMNEGYAPPDWDLMQRLNDDRESRPESPVFHGA